MYLRIALASIAVLSFAGCASVPMASKESDTSAKAFAPPAQGTAGLYIYRGGGPGTALKKDVWVDGKCVGETAPHVFFYMQVTGDQEHSIATESEFSPNSLKLVTAANTNYFIHQYIKMGVFVGGANLEVVDPGIGEKKVSELALATNGTCSK